MIILNNWHILVGIVFGLIYLAISYFLFKKNPEIINFFNVFLSSAAIAYSFKIAYNLSIVDKQEQLGIFKDDIIYLSAGILAIIWVSTTSLFKIYTELKTNII